MEKMSFCQLKFGTLLGRQFFVVFFCCTFNTVRSVCTSCQPLFCHLSPCQFYPVCDPTRWQLKFVICDIHWYLPVLSMGRFGIYKCFSSHLSWFPSLVKWAIQDPQYLLLELRLLLHRQGRLWPEIQSWDAALTHRSWLRHSSDIEVPLIIWKFKQLESLNS